jgi:hypothetical protein
MSKKGATHMTIQERFTRGYFVRIATVTERVAHIEEFGPMHPAMRSVYYTIARFDKTSGKVRSFTFPYDPAQSLVDPPLTQRRLGEIFRETCSARSRQRERQAKARVAS